MSIINYKKDFVVLSSLAIIRPNNNYINSAYLKYLFKSPFFLFEAIGRKTGVAIKRIVLRNLKTIQIPIPPLPEQKRIVKILDQAFEAIDKAKENAEKNLLNAKELFESYLNGIFEKKGKDWEEKKLGEVCEIKPPKNEAKQLLKENDNVTFLPMADLMELEKTVKPQKVKPLNSVYSGYTYFKENDVLLAKITPCFENGKLGIAKNLTNGVGFGSSEYIVFRVNENLIIPDFLFHFLSRNKFRDEGKNRMSGAVGHKRVQKDWIENYIFPFPTIEEQKQIVEQLDKLQAEIKKLEAIYQKKIEDLEELKKSILQKAFEGRL